MRIVKLDLFASGNARHYTLVFVCDSYVTVPFVYYVGNVIHIQVVRIRYIRIRVQEASFGTLLNDKRICIIERTRAQLPELGSCGPKPLVTRWLTRFGHLYQGWLRP